MRTCTDPHLMGGAIGRLASRADPSAPRKCEGAKGRATWAVCPARALHARVLPVRRRTCALSHSRTCGHRALARPALRTTSAMHRPTCDGRCHWAEPHGPTARLVPCMRARVLPVRRRACAFGGQCELNLGCHAKPLGATAMPGLLRLPCRGPPSSQGEAATSAPSRTIPDGGVRSRRRSAPSYSFRRVHFLID